MLFACKTQKVKEDRIRSITPRRELPQEERHENNLYNTKFCLRSAGVRDT